MPEAQLTEPTPAERAIDRQLLASIFISFSAAGLEVFIGYIVAHWITLTGNKVYGWVVSLSCLLLVVCGGLLALNAKRKLGQDDDTLPLHGRRVFMARLSLLVTAFCTLVVLAGTTVLLTVRPND